MAYYFLIVTPHKDCQRTLSALHPCAMKLLTAWTNGAHFFVYIKDSNTNHIHIYCKLSQDYSL